VAAAATEGLVTRRKRPYLAYLLRLWQVQDKGHIDWRASVENAHTGERVGFVDMDGLIAFLREQTGLAPPEACSVKGPDTPKMNSEPEEGGLE
jgi:hypothetical protein